MPPMTSSREARDCRAAVKVERRAAEDGAERVTLIGYAAVFNVEADLGWFREVVRPGAFAVTIAEDDDVRALFNHNADVPLGRTKAGTLRLFEDKRGLRYEIDLPDTLAARDLATSIERGDVTGSSFAFRVIDDAWHMEDGSELRELITVQLYDVSPVTYPAYEATDGLLGVRGESDCEAARRSRDAWRAKSAKRRPLSHVMARARFEAGE